MLYRDVNTIRLRQQYPLVEHTCADAQECYDTGRRMNADQWAAYIAIMTNIPTFDVCWGYHRRTQEVVVVGIAKHDHQQDEEDNPISRIMFKPLSEIARKGGRWETESKDRMIGWVDLLENERQRQTAWNYAHGHFTVRQEEGTPSPARLIRQALGNLKDFSMPSTVTAPQRKPVKGDEPKRLTEPVENFAAAVRSLYAEKDREDELPQWLVDLPLDNEPDPFGEEEGFA